MLERPRTHRLGSGFGKGCVYRAAGEHTGRVRLATRAFRRRKRSSLPQEPGRLERRPVSCRTIGFLMRALPLCPFTTCFSYRTDSDRSRTGKASLTSQARQGEAAGGQRKHFSEQTVLAVGGRRGRGARVNDLFVTGSIHLPYIDPLLMFRVGGI